jgi:hypothetical protein
MAVDNFASFTEALAKPADKQTISAAPQYRRIAILGGGDDGLLLASMCLSYGKEVALFSAYNTERVAMQNGITIRGEAEGVPIGTYQFNQESIPSIKSTGDLDEAVKDAEVIFLTGPLHKQRTYAMVLADHIRDGQVLVLLNGRTFGALETSWLLKVGGANADITLVEGQGLPYWINRSGNQFNLSQSAGVNVATLPANRKSVLDGLAEFLPMINPSINLLENSFSDASGLVEVPGLLLGGAAMSDTHGELPDGAVELDENKTFRNLLGNEHLQVVSAMAEERRKVATKFGVRNLPDDSTWLDQYAGTHKGVGLRPIPNQTMAKNIIRCSTLGSLVPLLSAAEIAGETVPVTRSLVDLAGTVLRADSMSSGRRLDAIGIALKVKNTALDDARHQLVNIMKGECR